MKKINLKNYTVSITRPTGIKEDVPYQVKDSIIELLYAPTLKLNGVQLLKQQQLVNKIHAAENDILLETEEYENLTKAINIIEGFGKNDVELVNRILNAEEVKVSEK